MNTPPMHARTHDTLKTLAAMSAYMLAITGFVWVVSVILRAWV